MLVLRLCEGRPLPDVEAEVAAQEESDATAEERRQRDVLIARVCEAWAVMVHVDGLFHSDPRPSNMLVQDVAGLGPVPVLVDFGMCKRLEFGQRLALSAAVITTDYH